jgi:hypothetical protein
LIQKLQCHNKNSDFDSSRPLFTKKTQKSIGINEPYCTGSPLLSYSGPCFQYQNEEQSCRFNGCIALSFCGERLESMSGTIGIPAFHRVGLMQMFSLPPSKKSPMPEDKVFHVFLKDYFFNFSFGLQGLLFR